MPTLLTPLETWEQVAKRMLQVTDRLGRSIDPGIFDTVVALNALGFTTIMSCEGHLDHGIAAPWVDLEVPDADILRQAITEQQRAIYSDGGIYPLTDGAKYPADLLKQRQLQLCKELRTYLDHFYVSRQVPYDQILILHPWGKAGRVRLQSIGAETQAIEDGQQQCAHLAQYQEEMQEFATYLKQIFYTLHA